ncbi:MAG: hypothetical protein ABL907_07775 [Hyphomicrobium sp.]
MAPGCGAFAAAPKAGPAAAVAAVSPIKAGDIAGRWTGNHYSYGGARAKCDDQPCTLTIDVSACASGWCGVMVKTDGGCGGSAMTVTAADGKESFLHFKGTLELNAKAVAYTVQATLWQNKDNGARHLDFIGDTGPELMFMRRSFPFQAHLARTGDAVCTTEKATS